MLSKLILVLVLVFNSSFVQFYVRKIELFDQIKSNHHARMFILQFDSFDNFKELLKSLAQIALVAKEVDTGHSKYLDDDLQPKLNYYTLSPQEHDQLDSEKQYANMTLLKEWLWKLIKHLDHQKLITSKKLSNYTILINKPGASLDINQCKDPHAQAELATQRGCRVLYQTRYSGTPMGSFKTGCCYDQNVCDSKTWSLLQYFEKDGFRSVLAYVHPLTSPLKKPHLDSLIQRNAAKIVQSKMLPFPKDLKHAVIKRFVKEHPTLINQNYSTITLLQILEYQWPVGSREPIITKGRRLLKMIWINKLKGFLYFSER